MVHRAVPVADAVSTLKGALQVFARMPDGIRHLLSQSQVRRNRGSEGAPRAVRVLRLYSCARVLVHVLAVEEDVDNPLAGTVTALYDNATRPHGMDIGRGPPDVVV